MPIWCPKCRYKTVLKRFYDDRCPQCRTVVWVGEVLTKDPYQPQSGMRKHDHPGNKKFVFDQVENVEGSGALKSHPVDPTFGIKGRI
jgi:Zn-finger nucleic acid-binding protein